MSAPFDYKPGSPADWIYYTCPLDVFEIKSINDGRRYLVSASFVFYPSMAETGGIEYDETTESFRLICAYCFNQALRKNPEVFRQINKYIRPEYLDGDYDVRFYRLFMGHCRKIPDQLMDVFEANGIYLLSAVNYAIDKPDSNVSGTSQNLEAESVNGA